MSIQAVYIGNNSSPVGTALPHTDITSLLTLVFWYVFGLEWKYLAYVMDM